MEIFRPPLEKCVGHSLKNVDPRSENSSPHPQVLQAGYMGGCRRFTAFDCWMQTSWQIMHSGVTRDLTQDGKT